MLRRVAQVWSEVTNAEPGQGALHAVHKARAFLDQGLARPIGPRGVLFGNRRYAHHAAMAPFATQPPQEPALQQLGVEPIGLCPAMFPRHGHTRGMGIGLSENQSLSRRWDPSDLSMRIIAFPWLMGPTFRQSLPREAPDQTEIGIEVDP